jgi:hypothetical protein
MTDSPSPEPEAAQRVQQLEEQLEKARAVQQQAEQAERDLAQQTASEQARAKEVSSEVSSEESPSDASPPAAEQNAAMLGAIQAVEQTLAHQGEVNRQLIAHMDETLGVLAGQISMLDQQLQQHVEQSQSEREAEDAAAQTAAAEQAQRLGQFEQTVFGPAWGADPTTADDRRALIDAMQSGDAKACRFVGQLLLVGSAESERFPTLLQDLGEAFYAYRPKTSDAADPLEQALVDAVHVRGDEVGAGNRIELVRVGDRFDNGFHDAKNRGVEIGQVEGWIVLRNNGKVYTRAKVTVH